VARTRNCKCCMSAVALRGTGRSRTSRRFGIIVWPAATVAVEITRIATAAADGPCAGRTVAAQTMNPYEKFRRVAIKVVGHRYESLVSTVPLTRQRQPSNMLCSAGPPHPGQRYFVNTFRQASFTNSSATARGACLNACPPRAGRGAGSNPLERGLIPRLYFIAAPPSARSSCDWETVGVLVDHRG